MDLFVNVWYRERIYGSVLRRTIRSFDMLLHLNVAYIKYYQTTSTFTLPVALLQYEHNIQKKWAPDCMLIHQSIYVYSPSTFATIYTSIPPLHRSNSVILRTSTHKYTSTGAFTPFPITIS